MHGLIRVFGSATLLAVIALTAGCNNELKAENDQLYAEVDQWKSHAGDLERALDARDQQLSEMAGDNARSRQEMRRLESEMAALRSRPRDPWDGIKDVTGGYSKGEISAVVESDLLFDPGKSTLKTAAKKTLDQIISVLKSKFSGHRIRVEGHTDTDPIKKSSWKTNDRLSCERAMAVKDYLKSKGIADNRMHVAGFGSTKAKKTKVKSRRVEIVVIEN